MIKFTSIITNGDIDTETELGYIEKGWTFVTTLPAYKVHPYALPTDMITIFSKYNSTPCPQSDGGHNQMIPVDSLRGDISKLEQGLSEKIHGAYIVPISQETTKGTNATERLLHKIST